MNIFKGLMFLQGHFVRPEDLDDGFAPLGNRGAGARWKAAHPGEARASGREAAPAAGATGTDAARDDADGDRWPARTARGDADASDPVASLIDDLLVMAGRPPRGGRGRNLILDAPFEPGPAANDAPAGARRPTACATC